MAKKAVVDAVKKRLAEHWLDRCPVLQANEQGETPADGSPYLLVQFPVANTDRMAVSNGSYREEGAIRILINTRVGDGIDLPMTWGEELADLFRFKKFDGVECRSATSPLIHDDNEEGNYFRCSVVVPYYFVFEDD